MVSEEERSGLIKAKRAATYVNTTTANLARLRYERKGPAYVRLGRSIRYRISDLDEWIESNVVTGS